MGRGHVLMLRVLVSVVLGLIESQCGIYWGRGGRLVLHVVCERVFVWMVEGDGLGGVGGVEVMAVVVGVVVRGGSLVEKVVGVSKGSRRHGGNGGRGEGQLTLGERGPGRAAGELKGSVRSFLAMDVWGARGRGKGSRESGTGDDWRRSADGRGDR